MILKKLYSLSRSLKPKDPSRKSTVILLTSNGKDKLNNTQELAVHVMNLE